MASRFTPRPRSTPGTQRKTAGHEGRHFQQDERCDILFILRVIRSSLVFFSFLTITFGQSSGLELGAIAKLLQRLGIGQSLDVLHRQAVHDVAHRKLDDLATLGARNIAHLHNLRRNMPRRGVGAYVALDAIDQGVVERQPVAEPHEQHHAHVADRVRRPILADDDALHDFVELFDLAVDLGGSDAYTTRIEGGVRAAIDDHPVVGGQLDPVAMTPYPGETLEVRRAILGTVRVVPESNWHRRERRSADELALLPAHRLAILVEDLDLHPQSAALQLTAPDGPRRTTEREAGDDVSAARDRRQAHLALDALIDVVEALGRQRA